ncbi:hypothetical protein [Howardella ureilytica]
MKKFRFNKAMAIALAAKVPLKLLQQLKKQRLSQVLQVLIQRI